MPDTHDHLHPDEQVAQDLPLCPDSDKIALSPLGWSIGSRLLAAIIAAALLWLAVGWAIGWLP